MAKRKTTTTRRRRTKKVSREQEFDAKIAQCQADLETAKKDEADALAVIGESEDAAIVAEAKTKRLTAITGQRRLSAQLSALYRKRPAT